MKRNSAGLVRALDIFLLVTLVVVAIVMFVATDGDIETWLAILGMSIPIAGIVRMGVAWAVGLMPLPVALALTGIFVGLFMGAADGTYWRSDLPIGRAGQVLSVGSALALLRITTRPSGGG